LENGVYILHGPARKNKSFTGSRSAIRAGEMPPRPGGRKRETLHIIQAPLQTQRVSSKERGKREGKSCQSQKESDFSKCAERGRVVRKSVVAGRRKKKKREGGSITEAPKGPARQPGRNDAKSVC